MFIISILLVPTFSIDSVFDLIRYTFGQTQRSSSCTCPIIISFFQNALGTRGTSRGGACANYPYSIKQNIAVHTGREESVSRVDYCPWYPRLQVPPDTFQVLYSCLSFSLNITFFRSLDTPDSYPVFTPPCSDHVYFENWYSSFSFDYPLFHSFYFSIHGSFHHWNIIDFASTSGTYLNLERLVPWVSYPLHCGDLLGVGNFLNLFRI